MFIKSDVSKSSLQDDDLYDLPGIFNYFREKIERNDYFLTCSDFRGHAENPFEPRIESDVHGDQYDLDFIADDYEVIDLQAPDRSILQDTTVPNKEKMEIAQRNYRLKHGIIATRSRGGGVSFISYCCTSIFLILFTCQGKIRGR